VFPHKVRDVNKISVATDTVAERLSDVSDLRDSLKSLVEALKSLDYQSTKLELP
jgi:hypothetical protein